MDRGSPIFSKKPKIKTLWRRHNKERKNRKSGMPDLQVAARRYGPARREKFCDHIQERRKPFCPTGKLLAAWGEIQMD